VASVATDKQQTSRDLMKNAYENATVIPAFNTPYLPMMAPIVQALVDTNSFGFVQVSYAECLQFEAISQEAVACEIQKNTLRLENSRDLINPD